MLRNCPYLEQVSVYDAENLVELSVLGPSIALKFLKIKYCWDIKRIQIRESNLVSLSYIGDPIELDLSNVPLLIEVSICYLGLTDKPIRLPFTQLSCCVNQLETLMLETPVPVDGLVHNLSLPMLPNLKNFGVTTYADASHIIPMLTSFLKAFPNLQRLILKIKCSLPCPREGEEMLLRQLECSSPFTREGEKMHIGRGDGIEIEKCPYRNIKVVEILGYRKLSSAVELVSYIVKNAVALERIVIDPARNYGCHSTRADLSIEEIKLEEEARDHAMHFIKKELPSRVEFICL